MTGAIGGGRIAARPVGLGAASEPKLAPLAAVSILVFVFGAASPGRAQPKPDPAPPPPVVEARPEEALPKAPPAGNRYKSTVRGESRHEGARFALEGAELDRTPGTLGDPFRLVSLLPGVATPVPLLPLYSIRGASPGANGFYLDGMRVPELFHLLIGGGVVNPHLVGRLDFYPGAYDVTFGRAAGGIIDGETRPARLPGIHADLELRLYDFSALLEMKPEELPGLSVVAAAHYGYPSALIHLLAKGVEVSYWDYQLRADYHGLTIEALGADDSALITSEAIGGAGNFNQGAVRNAIRFHRLQLRGRLRRGPVELEAAINGGLDEMTTFNGTGIRKLSLGLRGSALVRLGRFRLQAGADTELSRFTGENFDRGDLRAPDAFTELAGTRDGVVAGLYLQATIALYHDLAVTLGVRADLYHAGAVTAVGIDPRVSARMKLLPWLSIQSGAGVYQQPPAFPVALPGIDTFALSLGLQRALQGATTVEARLPAQLALTLTGFYERFTRMNDIDVTFEHFLCVAPPPEALTGAAALILRQVAGAAYGMELLLRRKSERARLTGWIAYTLSRSERVYSCGLRPSDNDQTHVLNVVVQARLPWRLVLGARLYVSSGLPYTRLDLGLRGDTPRNNERLPTYAQLDLRLDRDFTFPGFTLSGFLEVLNATASEALLGVTYPTENHLQRYDHPQPFGFRWALPSLGLRARW